MSRFDKHVKVHHLEIEHNVYKLLCNNDPELCRLLAMQMKARCTTARGIKYVLTGKRCSGDANTASGNCIIMLVLVLACMERLSLPEWDAFIDGDDTLLFVPRNYAERLGTVGAEVFLSMGFVAEFEPPAYELEDVEHCQSKPVEVNGRWQMVRNPMKAISHLASSYKHYGQPGGLSVLKSTLVGEMILSRGVPIVHAYCHAMLKELRKVKQSKWVDEDLWIRLAVEGVHDLRMPKFEEPDERTRESFGMAFGLDTEVQAAYEAVVGQVRLRDFHTAEMEFRDRMWSDSGATIDDLPDSLF